MPSDVVPIHFLSAVGGGSIAPNDVNLVIAAALGAVTFIALAFALAMRRSERVAERLPVVDLGGDAPTGLLSIAETANLIVGRIDVDGRFQWISPNVQSMLGVPAADFVSGRRSFEEFVHEDDRRSLLAAMMLRRQGRRDRIEFQYRLRAPDGGWRWFHERQGPVASAIAGLTGPPTAWEIVAVDLTDRRRADEQQRAALTMQQLSTRVLESFLQTEDIDTTIASALGLIGEYFRVARASTFLVDQHTDTVRLGAEWVAPGTPSAADRRRVVALDAARWWGQSLANGAPLVIVRDDESPSSAEAIGKLNPEVQSVCCVPIMTGTGPVPRNADPDRQAGRLRGAILVEDLERPRRWKAEEIATLQTLAFAIARALEQRDSADAGERYDGLQRQLERTELVAQLTGGIAHDFNNILFAISGHVELLRRKATDEAMRRSLADIEGVIMGARGIVGGLLQAHRGEIETPSPLPLAEELEAATTLAGRLMPRGVLVETDLGAANGCIARSTKQGLRQLVLNLVVNARDAVKGRGTIRLGCRIEPAGDLGPCAVLTVEDSGPGIPEELRERVLQPFFTTKGRAGTGLGLSICQRVAQEAGGRLKLDRSPSLGGLRVSAWLPLSTDEEIRAAALLAERSRIDAGEGADDDGERSPPEQRPVANKWDAMSAAANSRDPQDDAGSEERLPEVGHVLVVEDDPAVRDVLVAAFESLDIDVVARSDAMEVEAIVCDGPIPIDLLVMDIDLPDLPGTASLAVVRSRGDRTPCLFVTGGLTEPDAALAPFRVLRKPFRLDALMRACRAVLDERS